MSKLNKKPETPLERNYYHIRFSAGKEKIPYWVPDHDLGKYSLQEALQEWQKSRYALLPHVKVDIYQCYSPICPCRQKIVLAGVKNAKRWPLERTVRIK